MHWKTRGRALGVLILAGLFTSANSDLFATTAAAGDPVVQLTAGNAAMSDAEAAARRHVDRFFTRVMNAEGTTRDDASIKVAIPTHGQNAEVIWVDTITRHEGGFLGRLANTPRGLPDLFLGDTVFFTDDQIRDWSFVGQDGKLYGSYTTRALLPHLTTDQAARIAAILSTRPTPVDW